MGFLSGLELRKYRYVAPFPASFLLQAIGGLLYAQGACVAMIKRAEYTLSIGIASLCTCCGMFFTGVFINKMVPASEAHLSAVHASLIGSVALSAQIFIGIALSIDNLPLLYISAVIYGFGCGVFFISTVDVMQSWMPESPGLIVGVGLLCCSAGSILGIEAYRFLASSMGGPIPAIVTIGIISVLLAFPSSKLLRKPPDGWHPDHSMNIDTKETASFRDKRHNSYYSIEEQKPMKLSLPDIVSDIQFYLIISAYSATVGPGFALVLGFQSMVTNMFDVDISEASSLYIGIIVLGMAARPIIGICADRIGDRYSRFPRLSGVKRTMQILLLLQLLATICIPYFVRRHNLYYFVAACAIVYMTFTGGPVVTACLSGCVYNQRNACMIYSLIGVSAGATDFFFSWVVTMGNQTAAVGQISKAHDLEYHANDYNLFLWCSLIWSLAGFLATCYIEKSQKLLPHNRRPMEPHMYK